MWDISIESFLVNMQQTGHVYDGQPLFVCSKRYVACPLKFENPPPNINYSIQIPKQPVRNQKGGISRNNFNSDPLATLSRKQERMFCSQIAPMQSSSSKSGSPSKP